MFQEGGSVHPQRQTSCRPEDHIPFSALNETKELLRLCFGVNNEEHDNLPSAAELLKKLESFPAILSRTVQWTLTLHSSFGFSVQPTEYILQRSYKTVIPCEVRSMFPLDTKWLSELRPIKIFVLAFLEGVMQRINYDMSPKIKILFLFTLLHVFHFL